MARKQLAKKAKKPEASDSTIEEKKPNSPRGMPRSLAGCAMAVMDGNSFIRSRASEKPGHVRT